MSEQLVMTEVRAQRLREQLTKIKCKKHPSERILKICKLCIENFLLCSICEDQHELLHPLEDVESLVAQRTIKQIKDVADKMRRRLASDQGGSEPTTSLDSMFERFTKCIEDKKAELAKCFIEDIIVKRNEDLKSQLNSLVNKIDRKYRLIVETRGEDLRIVKDFLATYVNSLSFFNKIAESIRECKGKYSAYPHANSFMLEVETIFDCLKKSLNAKVEGLLQSRPSKNVQDGVDNTIEDARVNELKLEGNEPTQYNTNTSSKFNEEDDDEDCKIIPSMPASKNKNNRDERRESTKSFDRLTSGIEPQIDKRIKLNKTISPVVYQPQQEMDIETNRSEMFSERDDKLSGILSLTMNYP